MKKYNKIMRLFTKTLTELDNLVESNAAQASDLDLKAVAILERATVKANKVADKAKDLHNEAKAAGKASKKIKEFLS